MSINFGLLGAVFNSKHLLHLKKLKLQNYYEMKFFTIIFPICVPKNKLIFGIAIFHYLAQDPIFCLQVGGLHVYLIKNAARF